MSGQFIDSCGTGNGNKPIEPPPIELISQSIIRRGRNILMLSFFVIGSLGCLFIYSYWNKQNRFKPYLFTPFFGGWTFIVIRCWTFLVIMGDIHFYGYHFWRLQQLRTRSTAPPNSSPTLQDDKEIIIPQKTVYTLHSSLKFGLIVQIVVFILTALILDGGEMNNLCLVVIVGYCLGIEIILVRREKRLKTSDHMFIRYGMILLMIAAPFIAEQVYKIIGESYLNGLERLLFHR